MLYSGERLGKPLKRIERRGEGRKEKERKKKKRNSHEKGTGRFGDKTSDPLVQSPEQMTDPAEVLLFRPAAPSAGLTSAWNWN